MPSTIRIPHSSNGKRRWLPRPEAGFLLLAGCLIAGPPIAAASAESSRLRLVSWNLGNYLACNRMTAEGFRLEYPKPEAEKAALRSVLLQLRPDVLLLQEMGPASALAELQRDLRAEGLDYPGARVLHAPDEDRHLAVLWRGPAEVCAHPHLPLAVEPGDRPSGSSAAVPMVKRGLLDLRISLGGRSLRLFTCHLKSRYTADPSDPQSTRHRAGELDAVLEAIAAHGDPAGTWMVLVGDFNSGPGSEDWPPMSAGIKAAGFVGLTARDEQGEGWTLVWDRGRRFESFDHLFISSSLAESDTPAARAFIPAIEFPLAPSDHRPLVLDLAPAFSPDPATSVR